MSDKVILITGASSGFGFQVAQEASDAGYRVIAANRSSEALNIERVTVIPLDMAASVEDFRSFTEKAFAVHGRIDHAVFNAGVAGFGSVEESDLSDWELAFDVNFWGPFKLVKALLPHFIAQKQGGTFVFNSTQTFEIGIPLIGSYNSSKAALTAFADTLGAEVKCYDIQVVTLQAGSIRTPFTSKVQGPDTRIAALQPVAEQIRDGKGSEPLDPVRGAKRLLQLLGSTRPLPQRLPFGKQAYTMMTQRWTGRLQEFKDNEAMSLGLDFTD